MKQGAFALLIAIAVTDPAAASTRQEFLRQYCTGCHNDRLKTGGLTFDTLDPNQVADNADVWERVVRKVRAGAMPPLTSTTRPDPAAADGFLLALEADLDRAFTTRPNPGVHEALHRLNRAEYQNAIRDLLDLRID